jgi:hypothetical protein
MTLLVALQPFPSVAVTVYVVVLNGVVVGLETEMLDILVAGDHTYVYVPLLPPDAVGLPPIMTDDP